MRLQALDRALTSDTCGRRERGEQGSEGEDPGTLGLLYVPLGYQLPLLHCSDLNLATTALLEAACPFQSRKRAQQRNDDSWREPFTHCLPGMA